MPNPDSDHVWVSIYFALLVNTNRGVLIGAPYLLT